MQAPLQQSRTCPVCRGGGTVVATWRYIRPVPINTPMHTPPARSPPDTPFDTPGSHFPWWHIPPHIARGEVPSAYHIGTSLQDGRTGVLVDPGSWGNLCGSIWACAAAQMAKDFNKTVGHITGSMVAIMMNETNTIKAAY